jgi:hypothetical protein
MSKYRMDYGPIFIALLAFLWLVLAFLADKESCLAYIILSQIWCVGLFLYKSKPNEGCL